jgi:hypothetical protein
VNEQPTTETPEPEQRRSSTIPTDLFETAPPRGLDPDVPDDVIAEPLPIGPGDLWPLVRWTRKAERRWYPKLKRRRPRSARRVASSIYPALKRPVFVVGAARSGTSFLGDCIGRLPEISYHREPPATKAAGRYVYQDMWSYRRSKLFFSSIYRMLLWMEKDGDLRFSEKTPTNVFLIPFLAKAFPESQFVHIIRDGRDASSSHMQKPWLRAEDAFSGDREPGGYLYGPWPKFWVEPERRDEFLRTSDARRMAWAWRRYTEAGMAQADALGPERYHELRYESLVRDPDSEGERILDFLGIDAAKSRETFLASTQRADDSSVGTWRNTFYKSELAEIDAEAGDLLRELGYID